MQENLRKAILAVGLSELDAEIYLKLFFFRKEKLNVLKLSKILNVYRLKVSESLKKLEEVGLVELDQNNKIIVNNPKILTTMLKFNQIEIQKTQNQFEDILPSLLSSYYTEDVRPSIKVYEGVDRFIQLFNQVLEDTLPGSEIYFLGEGEDFYQIVPFEYYRVWGQKRIQKNIKAKVLAKNLNQKIMDIDSLNDVELREMKFLPSKFSSLGCVFIFNDNVVNWNTSLPRGVLIQDNQIASFYKNLFSVIWDQE